MEAQLLVVRSQLDYWTTAGVFFCRFSCAVLGYAGVLHSLGLFSIPLIEFLCMHEFKICLLTVHGFGNLCYDFLVPAVAWQRGLSPGVGDASPTKA